MERGIKFRSKIGAHAAARKGRKGPHAASRAGVTVSTAHTEQNRSLQHAGRLHIWGPPPTLATSHGLAASGCDRVQPSPAHLGHGMLD
jgi:hypothetical protein